MREREIGSRYSSIYSTYVLYIYSTGTIRRLCTWGGGGYSRSCTGYLRCCPGNEPPDADVQAMACILGYLMRIPILTGRYRESEGKQWLGKWAVFEMSFHLQNTCKQRFCDVRDDKLCEDGIRRYRYFCIHVDKIIYTHMYLTITGWELLHDAREYILAAAGVHVN